MQTSEIMKKFLYNLFVFFLLVLVIDISFGSLMKYVNSHADCDDIGRDNYICNDMNAEVLVFGSSRAHHHYNTVMMTDSLNVTCFNCGEDGYGIILAYGRLLMILKRYTPRMIIYDITPSFDYLDYKDNPKHLYRLKNFYSREGIDSIFWKVDPKLRIKMISNMYQYNSSYFRNVVSTLFKFPSQTTLNGFYPEKGCLDTLKIIKNHVEYDSPESYKIDSLKMMYLNKFVNSASQNNIKIVFVVSPIWYGQNRHVLEPIKELCDANNISLYDYSNDINYVHQNRLFKDGKHLNSSGADMFTREIIRVITDAFKMDN